MNPIQQATANRNKKIVIGVGILFAGLWVMLVMYVLAESQKYTPEVHPGVVEVHSASPTGGGAPAATYTPHHMTELLIHSSQATHPWSYITPKAAMSSTSSPFMRLYETSSASVHSVGGGNGGGGVIATTNGQSGSDRGIRVGGSYGSMLALASSVPMAFPGATQPAEVAHVTEAPGHNNMRVRKVIVDPFDPFVDPIGDVAWGLMALLATAYGYHLFRRNRPQSNEINK